MSVTPGPTVVPRVTLGPRSHLSEGLQEGLGVKVAASTQMFSQHVTFYGRPLLWGRGRGRVHMLVDNQTIPWTAPWETDRQSDWGRVQIDNLTIPWTAPWETDRQSDRGRVQIDSLTGGGCR